MAIRKKQQEAEVGLPENPLVREGGYRSKCHDAECVSIPFYSEDATGKRLGKICEVVQCHAYISALISDQNKPDTLSITAHPCNKIQCIIRTDKYKSFGVSLKTIRRLAEQGIFGVYIKDRESEQESVGIERGLIDD